MEQLLSDLLEGQAEMKKKLNEDEMRLCHYTSVSNAVSILRSGELWMRHPLCMNDVSEIKHGLEQVNLELIQSNNQLERCLDDIKMGFYQQVQSNFGKYYDQALSEHFVLCLSEFPLTPNSLGKLSMWRAYSGADGVCLVFKKDLFIHDETHDDNPGEEPIISKVHYTNAGIVKGWLDDFCQRLVSNSDLLRTLDLEEAARLIAWVLRNYVLSVKHPAFEEEKEWRVLYTDNGEGASYLKREVEIVNGVAQDVCKLDMKKFVLNGKPLEMKDLVERVLIGPTSYPLPIRIALIKTLKSIGIEDADQRVFITNIPLRV